jgi:hypothetical protein
MTALNALPLNEVHVVWEDRLALWGRLTETPAWLLAAPELKDLIFDWTHEPVAVVDAAADRMRNHTRLLEGLRQ